MNVEIEVKIELFECHYNYNIIVIGPYTSYCGGIVVESWSSEPRIIVKAYIETVTCGYAKTFSTDDLEFEISLCLAQVLMNEIKTAVSDAIMNGLYRHRNFSTGI